MNYETRLDVTHGVPAGEDGSVEQRAAKKRKLIVGGVLVLAVIVGMTVWRGFQRYAWRRDMGRQVQWLYLLVGLGLFLVIGLHGTLGAELAGEFGVHITADQLLAAGADLREALP